MLGFVFRVSGVMVQIGQCRRIIGYSVSLEKRWLQT